MTAPIEPDQILPAGPPATVDDGPTTRDLVRTAALAKVVSELITEATTDARDTLLERLKAKRAEDGTKSLSIDFDGVGKVGTVSLSEPKDKAVVVNRDAFTAWVEENFPTEVQYVVVVRSSWEKSFLDDTVSLDCDNGEVRYASDTGEFTVVPGLKAVPAGDPTSFSVRFDAAPKAKGSEPPKLSGKQKVAHLLTGESVAALIASPAPIVDVAAADEAGAA